MMWNKTDQEMPRDGRFILAFVFNVAGQPQFGLAESPVFLRWDGVGWVISYWSKPTKARTGDSSIAFWIEQEPPTKGEIDSLPPAAHPMRSLPVKRWLRD